MEYRKWVKGRAWEDKREARTNCQLLNQAQDKDNGRHKEWEAEGRAPPYYENWEKRSRGTHLGRKYFYQYGAYMILADFILATHHHDTRKENKEYQLTLSTHSYGGHGENKASNSHPSNDSWNSLTLNLPRLVELWRGPISIGNSKNHYFSPTFPSQ